MATTHVVSLFLPYTTHFHDKDEEVETPRPRLGHPPIHARRSVDLTKRGSTTSLLGDAQDIERANEALFDEFIDDIEQVHPITPGNPKALMRSDAHASDWGKQAIFNQPRSRAGPLPSASILDFAQVLEEQERRRDVRADRRTLSQITSRAQSSDRTFESKSWTIETALQGNGGLTNALRDPNSEDLVDITWHGTLGFPTDSLPLILAEDIADHLANEYQAQVVYISDKNFQGHYHGYCKTILWPILHYQVPDHPKSRAYADHSWKFYTAVNQAFADRVVEHYKRGDTIWVHDYHLLLVPKMIREKLPSAQIGFFLHTAFPSSEVFRCLTWRRELLEGMLGADLVAFQVEEYAEHFLQTCSRVLTLETTSEGVQLDDHFVNVISQPIGINLAAVNEQRETVEVHEWITKIQKRYHDKRIIVARDKLDSISGVRQKLLSYELFLNKYPEWRSKVVLIQVATAKEKSDQMVIIGDIVTRIEACHGTLSHSPLVFLRQDIPFSQYLALLSVADVLFVSSLREGMNLAAHDYVVCQDGQFCDKKHGSLILSEFTGSAAIFGDNQLPINPWDNQMQVRAIKTALDMCDSEKKRRWEGLYDAVIKQSGGVWAKSLSRSLREVHREHSAHDTISIPRLAVNQVSTVYKTAKSRVFILDYEGTLAPHRTQAGFILGSPERVIDALNDLIADTRNLVYIMSGRMPDELKQHFKTVPRLGLIAENGCFLREAGTDDAVWTSFPDMEEVKVWKGAVKNILKYYLERLDGTYLEERHCSLLLRFDHCEDKDAAVRMIGECADHINGSFIKMRVCAVPIAGAILIETMDFSKASAAAQLLKRIGKAVDFMFVAGDDRQDEGVFQWANGLGTNSTIEHVFTVSVGKRNTEAQATLTQGTSGLLSVLNKLAKLSADAQPVDYFNVKDRYRRESVPRHISDH